MHFQSTSKALTPLCFVYILKLGHNPQSDTNRDNRVC